MLGRTMKLLALLLPLLVACAPTPAPGDTLTPIGPPGWAEAVEEAVNMWAVALGPECPRYELGEDGYPVQFVGPDDAWPGPDNAIGWYDSGSGIYIRGTTVEWKRSILLHELGHGIVGPDHVDDVDSVMYPAPFAREISADDIARGREALGC